jgi:hypothetical protein
MSHYRFAVTLVALFFFTFAASVGFAKHAKAQTASATSSVEISGQCSLDVPVNGLIFFKQCPQSTSDNTILNAGFNGARLEPTLHQSRTPIWVHGTCQYVDSRTGNTNSLFIPLSTREEWRAFVKNAPPEVHLANCCLPRVLRVTDVPKPQASCAAGWQFKGLVDANDHSVVLATAGNRENAALRIAPGQEANLQLNIERDDIGAVSGSYVADFSCSGGADAYVPFRMQCVTSSWQTQDLQNTPSAEVSPPATSSDTGGTVTTPENGDGSSSAVVSPPVPTSPVDSRSVDGDVPMTPAPAADTGPVQSNDPNLGCVQGTIVPFVEFCPNGQDGFVTKRLYRDCSGGTHIDVISNTCGTSDASCPQNNIQVYTDVCPGGLTGFVTRKSYTDCRGAQWSAIQDFQCSIAASGCVESTILERYDPCPAGQTGTIHGRYYKSCPDGLRKFQVLENTCH